MFVCSAPLGRSRDIIFINIISVAADTPLARIPSSLQRSAVSIKAGRCIGGNDVIPLHQCLSLSTCKRPTTEKHIVESVTRTSTTSSC